MYIPLRVPSTQLPPYVHLDRSSQWHLSALLSMAVETMTLPSRDRVRDERVDLDFLERCLNVTGNQRIAGLQCSIRHRSTMKPQEEQSEQTKTANDGRLPASSIADWGLGEDLTNSGDGNHHMDFSGCGGGGSRKPEYIFGRVESLRGYNQLGGIADRDEPSIGMRKRRRLESHTIEKSVPRILCILCILSWLLRASLIDLLGKMQNIKPWRSCIINRVQHPSGTVNRGCTNNAYAPAQIPCTNSLHPPLIRLPPDIIPRSNSLSSAVSPAFSPAWSLGYRAVRIQSRYTRPCRRRRRYPAASKTFKSWHARWSAWKSAKISVTGWVISARHTRKDGRVDPMVAVRIETAAVRKYFRTYMLGAEIQL